MTSQEFKASLSEKLLTYIDKIERETGRQTRFEYVDDFGSPGVQFAFRKDPNYLCIALKSGISLADPRIERSIAHEITHCFLIYGLGYYALDANDNSSDEDILHLSLLSFIDDIIVNKTLQEHSFPPYSDTYLKMLKDDIQAAKSRVNIYGQSYSSLYNRRSPASRYILAWACIKYYKLTAEARKLMNQLLKVFPNAFPVAYQIADSLRKVILKNDIFSVDGHKEVIGYMLKEWKLENKCTFKSYKV